MEDFYRVTDPDLVQKVKKVLVKALRLRVNPEDIADDLPLMKSNGLDIEIDSIDALELVIAIENEFNVKIEDEEVAEHVFSSVDVLANFIREEQEKKNS